MNESMKIKNCSFYDIIGMESDWQVGYTGTININIPTTGNIFKYSQIIKKDHDEILGTYFAITGNYPNSENNILNILDQNELFNLCGSSYDVLIEATSFLRFYDNYIVAKNILEASERNGKRRTVVYLTNNDKKMMMYRDDDVLMNIEYDGREFMNNEVFYYYDQKHIIGTDFRQPNLMKGIIIIDDRNDYSTIAQGIYRMRKLNRGHTVDINYIGKKLEILSESPDSKENLYKQLVENDARNINNMKNIADLQMFKYSWRKYITNNYVENYLLPLYKFEDIESNISNIIHNNIKFNILGIDYDIDHEKYVEEMTAGKTEGEDILFLFNQFNELPVNNKIRLFFDAGSTQTDIDKNVEFANDKILTYVNSIINFDNTRILIKYYINPLSSTINEYFKWFQINDEKIKILFSINLFTVLKEVRLILCIIRLGPYTFLLENAYHVEYYMNKFPIYNLDGYLLNEYTLSLNPHVLEKLDSIVNIDDLSMTYKIIDVTNIFDYKLQSESGISYINMGDIINKIDPSKTIIIPDTEYTKIFTLFRIIFIYGNYNDTSDVTLDTIKEYYNISLLYNELKMQNDDEYREYIRSALEYDINKSSVTQQEYTYSRIVDPIDIYQQYCDVYDKHMDVSINKNLRITFPPPLTGGNNKYIHYKKYMKYMNKLLLYF